MVFGHFHERVVVYHLVLVALPLSGRGGGNGIGTPTLTRVGIAIADSNEEVALNWWLSTGRSWSECDRPGVDRELVCRVTLISTRWVDIEQGHLI